jgi:hypothetical protein
MDKNLIRNIGGLYAVIYTVFGLLFSFCILLVTCRLSSTIGLLFLFLPEFSFDLCFKIGLFALLVFSYLFGNKATIEIHAKRRNKYLLTYLYGILTVLTSSLLYSTVRLILYENIIEFDFNTIIMFFYRHLLIGLVYGLLSIFIFGTLFARQISRWKTL